jgi:hypothetical protein
MKGGLVLGYASVQADRVILVNDVRSAPSACIPGSCGFFGHSMWPRVNGRYLVMQDFRRCRACGHLHGMVEQLHRE